MRTPLLLACLAACALVTPAHADTQVWFGFPIDFRHAPPPPRLVIVSEPRVEFVHDVGIVTDDRLRDDMFRWHDGWYVCRDNYWYRSASWRGPWAVVDVRRVPRPIFDVPRERWRNHPLGGPPGQMKKIRGYDDDDDRGHGHGHGRGHDKDHGHDGDDH